MSRFPVEAIHLVGAEAQDRSSLLVFEFSSDHGRFVRWHRVYSKMPPRSFVTDELIELFLVPTGTWKAEYGEPHFEGVHHIYAEYLQP